jgi:ribose 1,5-bisphosphokinase
LKSAAAPISYASRTTPVDRRAWQLFGAKDSGLPEGIFVAVVGPSGAGKDTLLNGAAKALAGRTDIIFVRRIITRSPDGATEDHDTMSDEAFQAASQAGDFSLSWHANGLSYALPRSTITAQRSGATIVANLSRSVLNDAVRVYGSVVLIEVTATQEVLAQRLLARGRETAEDVEKRLQRDPGFDVPSCIRKHVVIDNSGVLEQGIGKMTDAILAARDA